MTRDDDLTLRAMRRLSPLAPDARRSEAVRARCHAALAQRREAPASGLPLRLIESGLATALSASLLAALIDDVLRLYRR